MNLYTKALYSGIIASLTGLLTALQMSPEAGLSDLSTASVVTIILAFFIASGGILGLQAAPAKVAVSTK